MNILLIDDHFSSRDGLKQLLEGMFADLRVFEAEGVEGGLEIGRRTPLNLVLLDIQLPGRDGMEGLNEFKREFPELCVVMFSGLDEPDLVIESLRLGAMGFIPKSVSRDEFEEALRDVVSGRPYVPASLARRPADGVGTPSAVTDRAGFRVPTDPATLGLTTREFQVLAELVRGRSNKEIARRLAIGEQTVKNHLHSVSVKFAVRKRTELVVKAFERGIVFGPPEVGNQAASSTTGDVCNPRL